MSPIPGIWCQAAPAERPAPGTACGGRGRGGDVTNSQYMVPGHTSREASTRYRLWGEGESRGCHQFPVYGARPHQPRGQHQVPPVGGGGEEGMSPIPSIWCQATPAGRPAPGTACGGRGRVGDVTNSRYMVPGRTSREASTRYRLWGEGERRGCHQFPVYGARPHQTGRQDQAPSI